MFAVTSGTLTNPTPIQCGIDFLNVKFRKADPNLQPIALINFLICDEARTDLKAFTPQNKQLKIARAICAKQSTNNDNEKINQNTKHKLVMAWIAGIFKGVVLQ